MKIFERIADGRIRDNVQLSSNQCGFVAGSGTTDAIHAARVSEELIEWVRILYSCPKSRVQAAAETSMEFPISVGVHQGSALSLLLFVVVIDDITRDLQKAVTWALLYADDVMLASEGKGELEREVQAWFDRLERFGLRLSVKKTE
ncbi:unnamed protein product [Heligmosomoides polygyrus]|uniref:Reverse transcriptase domain-containing protein n=1 Tax=Heligmosomoides polygyrus TaxID=6339 RepID=A0A183GGL3_HELPZ|nr:unnamed protein product [Heligmosomoides polygyrus]